MAEKDKNNTRERILRTAARLFSEKGYDKVTIREIAKDIDINPASLYYHFISKEEILLSLYDFYSGELRRGLPDLTELLQRAKTDEPLGLLASATYNFDEDKQEMLNQIQITAARRLGNDPDSEIFIRENMFDTIRNIIKPLLERLVELCKIKPLDINKFIDVFSYYNFSAGVLTKTSFGHDLTEYQETLAWLFSLFIPAEE